MKNNPETLLVVDDDPGHRIMLITLLGEWGYQVQGAEDGATAIRLCHETPFDLVLMDIRMAGLNGIEALTQIKAWNPAIIVLIMTAWANTETAVSAMKAGAWDYLTKPLDFDELKMTIERALDHVALSSENQQLRNELATQLQLQEGMVARSDAMRQVMNLVQAVAPSEATVLIGGESGTGKERIARLIHDNSPRRNGPFIAINCGALSESLLESELFGHAKGAFTGAEKARPGRFAAANKGTLFLDEIGEMPLPMQVKLLRVIQEREVQRLGEDQPQKIDVRLLAATNRDLQERVAAGEFRQDLWYRLNVVSITLPPLCERVEDIPLLADAFLTRFAKRNGKQLKGFTPQAMDRMLKYRWPGNIRELENAVERAVVLAIGDYVGLQVLPPTLNPGDDQESSPLVFDDMSLEEIEQAAIARMLEVTGGNKSEAARRLGITRKTLHQKISRSTGESGPGSSSA